MVTYLRAELCLMNHDRPPVRAARKAIFSHQLWLPSRERAALRAKSRDTTNVNTTAVPNVNILSDHCSVGTVGASSSSSLKVGWLNVQSLSNKTTVVYETIDDKRLDVIALTETWHRSSSDISLRLAAPPGFDVIDAVRESDPGHGGVAVIYRRR